MLDASTSRSSAKGRKRRQEILDTARQILVDEGWEAFSMRDVAARLGIRHGHLQYYFPTKQDLLVALYDTEVSAYISGVTAASSVSQSPAELIAGILNSGIATVQRPETELWRIAAALARRDENMAAILARDNEVYRDALVASFGEVAPTLTKRQRALLARFIQVLVDGLSLQLLTDDPTSSEIQGLIRLMNSVVANIFQDEIRART